MPNNDKLYEQYIRDGMARMDDEDAAVVEANERGQLEPVADEPIGGGGVMGMMWNADTPETIQEMGEAAAGVTKHGLPIAGAIAGGMVGGLPGEMVGGAAGSMLGSVLTGEIPDFGEVMASAVAPGVGRAAFVPLKAVIRSFGKYLPGYAVATHDAAYAGAKKIVEQFRPAAGEAKRLYNSTALKNVYANVAGIRDLAQEILERELAEPLAGQLRHSVKAARYVAQKLGYVVDDLGRMTVPEGKVALQRMSVNEVRNLARRVFKMVPKGKKAAEEVKDIKHLYKKSWDTLREVEKGKGLSGGMGEYSQANAISSLKEANKLQGLEWAMRQMDEGIERFFHTAGEQGQPFQKGNIRGLMDFLTKKGGFKGLIDEKTFNQVMNRLESIVPVHLESGTNSWWASLMGRAAIGAVPAQSAGVGAIGALGGSAVGTGIGRASMSPLGRKVAQTMAGAGGFLQKGATPRGVGAEVIHQGLGLLDHLLGDDEAPTAKEDLEAILGFDKDKGIENKDVGGGAR